MRSQNLQVAFEDNRPTYRVIPGISTQRHAEFDAEKVGFSSTDIATYLKRKAMLNSARTSK